MHVLRVEECRSHLSAAIQLCLADQLHHNVEAYVDDVVINTKSHDKFIPDLGEIFNSIRKFQWKLNPTKCIFGVPQGKLLGFIISHQGIEANLEKITSIIAMDSPQMIKDV
jgi:predicted metallo-beta-lactamase superfamily hydrolase